MRLEIIDRTGLLPEHHSVSQHAHQRVRLTVPAREALESAGARVTVEPNEGGPQTYVIEQGDTVPPGLVVTRINGSADIAIRRDDEPEYPGEIGHAYWEQVDFSPCPVCGAPLVWYEDNYVPGYRVCAAPPHHHVQAEQLE